MELAKTVFDTSSYSPSSHLQEERGARAELHPLETSETPATPLIVRVIRDVEEWDALEGKWRELFKESPAASPVLTWEWLRQWWQIYGSIYGSPKGLRLLTVWRDDRLIAGLPLYQCRTSWLFGVRRLRFISTGEAEFEETCPNYLDLLCLPDHAASCLEALQEYLLQSKEFRWDELYLSGLPENSPLKAWQDDFVGPRYETSVTQYTKSTISSIESGLDAYLGRLSGATRKEMRRLLKSANEAGARLEVAQDQTDIETFFEQLIDLHQRRWNAEGRPGCFAAPRFTQFHRDLAHQLIPSGKALLARFVLDDKPLAVFFGYIIGSKFDLYVSGVASGEAGPIRSPGSAGHLFLMDYLAQRGITLYDHLASSGPSYKSRFGTEERGLFRIRVVRRGLRVTIHSLAETFGRVVRKCWHLLRRRARTNPPASR
jgi:CelD/BcsL family acetyltransferase involved in cellulose biosynthesis